MRNRALAVVFHQHPVAAFIATICILCASPTYANQCQHMTYNGGDHSYPAFFRHHGQGRGFVNDALNIAAQKTNIQLSLKPSKPWKRILRELSNGDLNFVAGIIKTSVRSRDFTYSKPISKIELSIFVRSDSSIEFSEPSDLKGLTGVKLLGLSLGEDMDKYAFENLVIHETSTLPSAFKMVEAGRVDFVVAYREMGLNYLRDQNKQEDIRIMESPLSRIDIYVAASKQTGCFTAIENILLELDTIEQAGFVRKLKQQYIKQGDTNKADTGGDA